MPKPACQTIPVPAVAAIDVRGADAETFLAAQLSQRPPQAGARRAPLAAWHDAKGRVQALFRVLRDGEGFRLLTDASIAADVAAALGRYVMRARVSIEARGDRIACAALLGTCGEWLEGAGVDLPAEAGATTAGEDVAWLRLGPALIHVIGPPARLETLTTALPRGEAAAGELAEIRLGLPAVSAPLRGLFLPQMLNLDRLGAIAFDKGCYPGQEIIARTQNLGAVKRRLRRFRVQTSGPLPTTGSAILDAAGTNVGTAVRAARADGVIELLAVVQLEALSGPLVHEGSAGAALTQAQLPYEAG